MTGRWVNNFRRMGTGEVVYSFTCRCSPDSQSHDRMVLGALRNAREDVYLEDGIEPNRGAEAEGHQP